MRELTEGWIAEKLSRRPWILLERCRVSAVHKRPLGARGEYAGVVLSAAPADRFCFVSDVTWPTSDNYDNWVLSGALDVLLCSGTNLPIGLTLTLESIEWHDVDSCAVAFYWATRAAVLEIAAFDAYGYPRNFRPPGSPQV